VFAVAILLIIVIVFAASYLISREANSENAEKKYGRIVAGALVGILVIVLVEGILFITYFK